MALRMSEAQHKQLVKGAKKKSRNRKRPALLPPSPVALVLGELARITVLFDLAMLGENRLQGKPAGYIKHIKDLAGEAAYFGWLAAGKPQIDEDQWPVVMDLVVRRGRKLDQNNCWGAVKRPLDSVCCAGGILPADSEKYLICGEVKQETGAAWLNRPEFVMLFRKRGEA